jgi:hypothetical protein
MLENDQSVADCSTENDRSRYEHDCRFEIHHLYPFLLVNSSPRKFANTSALSSRRDDSPHRVRNGVRTIFHFFRLFGMAMRLGDTRAWPILSLEIHSPICYAHRSVPLVFFGNPINENQRSKTLPYRGKFAILTPKNAFYNNNETIEKITTDPR